MRFLTFLLILASVYADLRVPIACEKTHNNSSNWSYATKAGLMVAGGVLAFATFPGTIVVGGITLPYLGTILGTSVATGSALLSGAGATVSVLSATQLTSGMTSGLPDLSVTIVPHTIAPGVTSPFLPMEIDDPCHRRRVIYITNRAFTLTEVNETDVNGDYERRSHHIRWGEALVNIPTTHKPGSKDVSLLSITDPVVMDMNDIEKLGLSNKNVLIYTHGWRNTFRLAIETAGQIAYDIDFAGTIIVFAWPSGTTLLRYSSASDQVAANQLAHTSVLSALLDSSGGNIHLLGHSLGTRLVWRSLLAIERDQQSMGFWRRCWLNKFQHVILAAADMDLREFNEDRLSSENPACAKIHLWTNPSDYALLASQYISHGQQRLGTHKTEGYVHQSLSHSYFSNNPGALDALKQVLES